ncbi:hypothetical protein [Micromonospora sp. NBC_01796]|uniref:hypothetical protein n=1 Tax=Micromonospora sp. NBC_01796 TaxID=2975987 RepID=UPI002DDB02FB|nr:hypothetical protein [Micromonospora sp. NBC_01796]WSA86740.1 hypothetical protein OIE47_03695 [Micromonospora sp. NBC_01796]
MEAVVAVRQIIGRLGVVLAGVTGVGLLATGTPVSAAPGFDTRLDLPGQFTAGGDPATISAVVGTSERGECRKVRWSLVLRVAGLRLDQVRVDRVEETGSFPVQVRADGDTARLTDNDFDPGELCRDRTVTARYRIAFGAEAAGGRVTVTAEAFDARSRLLASGSATRTVAGNRARATPSATRTTASPSPEATEAAPEESAEDEQPNELIPVPTEEPVVASGTGGGRPDPAANSGGLGLVQVGFLTGALLLFLGVGLLMRVRHRLLGAVTGGAGRALGRGAQRAGRSGGGPFRRRRRRADSGADGAIDLGADPGAGYGRPVWQTDEPTVPVWRRR